MSDVAVKLNKVSKTFRKSSAKVLDEISITLLEGDIVSIVGKNGSGKSTLLRVMAGLITPDEGRVYRKFSLRAKKGMIIHLHELNDVFKRSTPYEVIEYFAILNGVRIDRIFEYKIEELLMQFDLHGAKYVADLSRGMKQKLSMCCSLAVKPKILLLDEPTLGLDIKSTDLLSRKLKELSQYHRTCIVIATHDAKIIEGISTKTFLMKRGAW